MYSVLIKENLKISAKTIINILKKKGVECRPFFYPMHLQPIYRKMKIFDNSSFPVSEMISKKGFYIPSGIALTKHQQAHVANSIKEITNSVD